MSSYQQFLEANQPKLLGHFLLMAVSKDSHVLKTPYPPSALSEEQLEELKDQLRACMPVKSMIIDLWDWDVHFEECLSDDWYFGAVFGDEASVCSSAEELAEFFLEKCDEYGMDYNQTDDYPEFEDLIRREAKGFIKNWRQAVVARYA